MVKLILETETPITMTNGESEITGLHVNWWRWHCSLRVPLTMTKSENDTTNSAYSDKWENGHYTFSLALQKVILPTLRSEP